jgi:hypothetical protein
MKKASLILLTLFVSLTYAVAQQAHVIVNIPAGALKAAYRGSFGQNPDFGNYRQVALAINRAKSQYFPGAAGGFWNGVVTQNDGDRNHDTFSIVTIGKGPFERNPQQVPIKAFNGPFWTAFGRRPDFLNYRDMSLAIDKYRSQIADCAGGFWDGEQTVVDGVPCYEMVWTQSPEARNNILVAQLAASFARRAQRPPDFRVYGDLALAITGWIQDHIPGKALGGLWDGEQNGSGPGAAYGIVLVR